MSAAVEAAREVLGVAWFEPGGDRPPSEVEVRAALFAALPHLVEGLEEMIGRHRATAAGIGRKPECLCGWRASLRDPSYSAHVAAAIAEELKRRVEG